MITVYDIFWLCINESSIVCIITSYDIFLAKPSLEGLPENKNDNVRPTHQLSRQKRQSNFLSEVIDPEDRVCLPRYECDTQRTPSTNILGSLGLVQDNFFKNSNLREQVSH